jgi:hypothetical protein
MALVTSLLRELYPMVLTICLVAMQWILAMGLLQCFKQYYLMRLVPKDSMAVPFEWTGFADGYQLKNPDVELFCHWSVVAGLFCARDRLTHLGPSALSRAGLAFEVKSPADDRSIKRMVQVAQTLMLKAGKKFVGKELIAPHEFSTIHFTGPMLVSTGKVTSETIRRLDFTLWLVEAVRSFWFFASLIFLTGFVVANLVWAITEQDSLRFVLIGFFSLFLLLAWARAGRVVVAMVRFYLFPSFVVSKYEVLFCEQGMETRTNASHSRCRWGLFYDVQQEEDKLSAINRFTRARTLLLHRDFFESESMWHAACELAARCIPKS